MNLSPLITGVAALQRLDGVAGVMLFKGRNIVHRQVPFSDGRAMELLGVIEQMMDGYFQVRRKIRQIYLQFDGGTLLLSVQGEAVLLFVLTGRADADLVASSGSVLMNDHAILLAALSKEPGVPATTSTDGVEELVVTSPRRLEEITSKASVVVNNWGGVRKLIENVLGKVMGRAQAANLIDRTLTDREVVDPYRLNSDEVLKLAVAVIEQIPNTGKRRQLLQELESRLAEL